MFDTGDDLPGGPPKDLTGPTKNVNSGLGLNDDADSPRPPALRSTAAMRDLVAVGPSGIASAMPESDDLPIVRWVGPDGVDFEFTYCGGDRS